MPKMNYGRWEEGVKRCPTRRLFRKAVQQGRSKWRGEAYSRQYVEPLHDATCLREALRRRQGTPLEACINSLLKAREPCPAFPQA